MPPKRKATSRDDAVTDEEKQQQQQQQQAENKPTTASPKRSKSTTNTKTTSSETANDSTSSASKATAKDTYLIMILSPAKTLDLSPLLPPPPPDLPPAKKKPGRKRKKTQPPTDEEEEKLSITTALPWTTPDCDATKTAQLVKLFHTSHAQSVAGLSKLLGISTSLAETAHSYWNHLDLDRVFGKDNNKKEEEQEKQRQENKSKLYSIKPCGFTFSGPAYLGMQIGSLNKEELQYLQDHLRIIDPLWGLLRPMDTILPYRMEMATKKVFAPNDQPKLKLSEFWAPAMEKSLLNTPTSTTKMSITNPNQSYSLIQQNNTINNNTNNKNNQQQQRHITIINLASEEYAAAVKPANNPRMQLIDVVFRQDGKVISVHAKRARGLMCRYMAQNDIQDVAQLANFQEEGYHFQPTLSDMDALLVFDRSKHWNTKTTNKKKKTETNNNNNNDSDSKEQ